MWIENSYRNNLNLSWISGESCRQTVGSLNHKDTTDLSRKPFKKCRPFAKTTWKVKSLGEKQRNFCLNQAMSGKSRENENVTLYVREKQTFKQFPNLIFWRPWNQPNHTCYGSQNNLLHSRSLVKLSARSIRALIGLAFP